MPPLFLLNTPSYHARAMKIQNLLQEDIGTILDTINATCETNKAQCARYLSTVMVLKDMGKLLPSEDHKLHKNTYIDYLFGAPEHAKLALNHFYKRIQENPRARRLFRKYEVQFLDHAYGHTVMRNRIETLKPYFNQRKVSRIKYHEDRLITNLAKAQDKIAAEHKEQFDLSDGDKLHDQALKRQSGS